MREGGGGLSLIKHAIGVEILPRKGWVFAMVSCLRVCLTEVCPRAAPLVLTLSEVREGI